MFDIVDTLKTSSIGAGGWWLTISGWLPDMVSVLVGMTIVVYLITKIISEIRRM